MKFKVALIGFGYWAPNIAKNLFQVYEYTRITLIEEFKSCKVNKSMNALTALIEIRDSWKSIS